MHTKGPRADLVQELKQLLGPIAALRLLHLQQGVDFPATLRLVQLGLEQELADRFTDFREGYLGAPEHRVVAEALEYFMADRLIAEPEVKRRYEAAREMRLGIKGSVVKLVPNGR
jgi:hypothetical protein